VNEAMKNKKLTEPCHMTQVNQSCGFNKLLLHAYLLVLTVDA